MFTDHLELELHCSQYFESDKTRLFWGQLGNFKVLLRQRGSQNWKMWGCPIDTNLFADTQYNSILPTDG